MNPMLFSEGVQAPALDLTTSQDILDAYGITEYSADQISTDFDEAVSLKGEQARIFKILDAADHSDIWKTYNRKLPSYVQTPVNNPITVIKEATKASIMPTSYQGDFRPMNIAARELAEIANKYFQMSGTLPISMKLIAKQLTTRTFMERLAYCLVGMPIL